MVGLGDLYMDDNLFSRAMATNSDGSIIVGHGSPASGFSGQEAFLWTETGGMIGLGDLPGGIFFSGATGVSDDGSIVVGNGDNGINSAAFIWDRAHGMRDLRAVLAASGVDMSGWYLRSAMSISADGTTIVGDGFHGERVEGWVAVIPEPTGAIAAVALGAGLALGRRRRDVR